MASNMGRNAPLTRGALAVDLKPTHAHLVAHFVEGKRCSAT